MCSIFRAYGFRIGRVTQACVTGFRRQRRERISSRRVAAKYSPEENRESISQGQSLGRFFVSIELGSYGFQFPLLATAAAAPFSFIHPPRIRPFLSLSPFPFPFLLAVATSRRRRATSFPELHCKSRRPWRIVSRGNRAVSREVHRVLLRLSFPLVISSFSPVRSSFVHRISSLLIPPSRIHSRVTVTLLPPMSSSRPRKLGLPPVERYPAPLRRRKMILFSLPRFARTSKEGGERKKEPASILQISQRVPIGGSPRDAAGEKGGGRGRRRKGKKGRKKERKEGRDHREVSSRCGDRCRARGNESTFETVGGVADNLRRHYPNTSGFVSRSCSCSLGKIKVVTSRGITRARRART